MFVGFSLRPLANDPTGRSSFLVLTFNFVEKGAGLGYCLPHYLATLFISFIYMYNLGNFYSSRFLYDTSDEP